MDLLREGYWEISSRMLTVNTVTKETGFELRYMQGEVEGACFQAKKVEFSYEISILCLNMRFL